MDEKHSEILVEKEHSDLYLGIYILNVNIRGYFSELSHITSFISLDISFHC